jgi:hypothetical protein
MTILFIGLIQENRLNNNNNNNNKRKEKTEQTL